MARIKRILLIIVAFVIVLCVFIYGVLYVNFEIENKKIIEFYEMTQEEINNLPSDEIINLTLEDENSLETELEDGEFKEQGNISYDGENEYPNIKLGDYKGLIYYSQLDSRWKNHLYTVIGKTSQTIGNSGCGPTCAAMIVTATIGTITPDKMGDLFVEYGFRSSNNGTYWSAFRWIADTFDIEYQQIYDLDSATELLRNNYYITVSVGNGLFTTGGHFINIVGIEEDTLKIYDPYLYNGKFDVSTRKGKVKVSGNTVYCSIENFRKYANYQGFFAFKNDEIINLKDSESVDFLIKIVTAKIGLNVRNKPDGEILYAISPGTVVTIFETSGNWCRIGEDEWVAAEYLNSIDNNDINYSENSTYTYNTGRYKVNTYLLNVRTGPSTIYLRKKYYQLTYNARMQNRELGNYYANGYLKNVICDVIQVNGNWGLTNSGWICLDYCIKI